MFNGGQFFGGIGDAVAGYLDSSEYQNPSTQGLAYLNQAAMMMPGYYQPFINAGLQALPQLQAQYGQLISNPGQRMNQIGQSFQQSPGYQFQVNQALGAANRAAAAGGMAGSPMEQQNIAGTVNQLANQDYYNYLGHAMNMYGMGLQGDQGLYNTGYNASNELASNLANILQSMAGMSYAGTADRNMNKEGSTGMMVGGLSSAIGSQSDLGSILGQFEGLSGGGGSGMMGGMGEAGGGLGALGGILSMFM